MEYASIVTKGLSPKQGNAYKMRTARIEQLNKTDRGWEIGLMIIHELF